MREIREKSITIVQNKLSIYALAGLIFMCLFSYAYFANSAVRSLTLLEKSKSELAEVRATITDLETKRLKLLGDMGIERAKSLGFVESNPTFVKKGSSQSVLSLRN